ncbi:MAG: MarR family winged helix-turn-helix transcriptional regulator [Pseudomonadota bacterium]
MSNKLKLVHSILHSMDEVQLRYRHEYRHGLQRHAMNPAEADVLLAIGGFDGSPPSVSELAKVLCVDTLPSRSVKRLRSLGYIVREDDDDDDRIRRLRLTKEGLNAYREVKELKDSIARTVSKNVSRQDLQVAMRVCEAIKW